MVQSDKSIHPVVLYKLYLICIFMNIHENLKNEGKSRKIYKPRGGVEVRSRPFKFMPNCSVGLSESETKFTSKYFGMGYVKMHVFHGNTLIWFSRMVGRPTNSIISRVPLILEH